MRGRRCAPRGSRPAGPAGEAAPRSRRAARRGGKTPWACRRKSPSRNSARESLPPLLNLLAEPLACLPPRSHSTKASVSLEEWKDVVREVKRGLNGWVVGSGRRSSQWLSSRRKGASSNPEVESFLPSPLSGSLAFSTRRLGRGGEGGWEPEVLGKVCLPSPLTPAAALVSGCGVCRSGAGR